MSAPHFRGRRVYRDGKKVVSAQSSNDGGLASSSGPSKTQWLSARSQSSMKPHSQTSRLTQEKLIFPGEAGNGIATPRAFAAGHKNTPGTSGSKSSARSSAGTLDMFLRPRNTSTPSQSKSSERAKTEHGKGKAPLSFAPVSNSRKGKQVVVHVVEDESQVQFLGFTDLALAHDDEQQQRHHISNNDATTSSDAEPDLCSETEEYASLRAGAAPHTHCIEDKEPTPYVLPPMPTPVPRFLRSIFGFGELPPPCKPMETANTKKRKRAVVESSSPVKSTTLAGPSSPAPSTRSTRSDSVETVAPPGILAAETEQQARIVTSNCQASSKASTGNTAAGHGDRIAWGTQDDLEYRRLNRTESERLVDEQLIVRRGPREALPATQERTDYMDRFRSESYSPVQYTATEGQMNEFRRRVGLSPIQKLPSQRHTSTAVQQPSCRLPMMDLEDDEATEISEPPSQHRQMRESFDESATQQSTCPASSEGIEEVTMMNSKADDSGFVQSSPGSVETRSSPKSDCRLEDALAKARIEVVDERSSSLSPISLAYPPSFVFTSRKSGLSDPAAHLQKEETCLDASLSSSEGESDFDESTVLTKPRERRILALATQETQDFETQFIRMQETQLVECSQEESAELDLVIDMDDGGMSPVETATTRVANAAIIEKQGSKVVRSVTEQIDDAWFPQILANATAASAAKANEPEQSILTDFFGKKPGGPAEKAAADKKAREKEFANAVAKQRRESRKMKVDGPGLNVVVEGDDNDDIQVEIDDSTLAEAGTANIDDVREVEDSDTEEMMKELDSQTQSEVRLPCEGWVLGQKRHKTPTPVKLYRYRHIRQQ